MSAPPLLLDEMLSPHIAEQLRSSGWDVTAVAERRDLVGMSDADVLALATEEQRIVVTLNIADFAKLAQAWASHERPHAGVLLVSTTTFRQDRGFVGAVVAALDHAARADALPGSGQAWFLQR